MNRWHLPQTPQAEKQPSGFKPCQAEGMRKIYLPGNVTAYVRTDDDVKRVTHEAVSALLDEVYAIRKSIKSLHRERHTIKKTA